VVPQLNLACWPERRRCGDPEAGRRGDGRGGLRHRRGGPRRACERRRRREGRCPVCERRLALAPDGELLKLGDLVLVLDRQPVGLHNRVAILLQNRLDLGLQPADRAPEDSELLVAAAHLLNHRGPGAEASLSCVRAELDEVGLLRLVERRVDLDDAGGSREVMDGHLRVHAERVLDVDHRQPVDRPALEGDLDLHAEHHVQVIGHGEQAALSLDAERDEGAHLGQKACGSRAHPAAVSPLRELGQLEEVVNPGGIDANTEPLVRAVHDPHIALDVNGRRAGGEHRHQCLEFGPRVRVLGQYHDEREGAVPILFGDQHGQPLLRTQVGAQELNQALLDHDEDEAGCLVGLVVSTHPRDALRPQPVKVLRTVGLDELGVHAQACAPPHLN